MSVRQRREFLTMPLSAVANGSTGLRCDLFQLGNRERYCPLISLIQLQSVSQVRQKESDGLALSLGEQYREDVGRSAWLNPFQSEKLLHLQLGGEESSDFCGLLMSQLASFP